MLKLLLDHLLQRTHTRPASDDFKPTMPAVLCLEAPGRAAEQRPSPPNTPSQPQPRATVRRCGALR